MTSDREPAVPDFSPLAACYARSRPVYPPRLFAWLASRVDRHALAWDCGTGSGQAAVALAERFERVVATDVSAEQLRHAAPHPRVEYRVAPAEASGIAEGAVDLVTVAAAVHWFDLDRFGAEVRRVVRHGGVLAVWTYHASRLAPPLGGPLDRFYREVVGPYFAAGARLVDGGYETIPLPGEPIDPPEIPMTADWTLERLLDYVASWSGLRAYREGARRGPAAGPRRGAGRGVGRPRHRSHRPLAALPAGVAALSRGGSPVHLATAAAAS